MIVKSADEIINDIKDTLCECDGNFIAHIANLVLSHRVSYEGDSLFEVEE